MTTMKAQLKVLGFIMLVVFERSNGSNVNGGPLASEYDTVFKTHKGNDRFGFANFTDKRRAEWNAERVSGAYPNVFERGKLRKKRADKVPAEVLRDVARYLAGYKYRSIDHRVWDMLAEKKGPSYKPADGRKPVTAAERPREGEYVRNFPIPPLEVLNSDVKKACDKGYYSCVMEIYKTVLKSPKKMFHKIGFRAYLAEVVPNDGTPEGDLYRSTYRPFNSFLERYEYRVTASYYMCWFTLNKEPDLKYFKENCSLAGLETFRMYKIPDYRTDLHNTIPYACALLSFCPDVCYGDVIIKEDKPITSSKECANSKYNPCRGIGKGQCALAFSNNKSFQDLVNNKLNYTCRQCYMERKGFEWNQRFKMCVDADECSDGTRVCDKCSNGTRVCDTKNKICRNTVGSYYCACDRGYKSDATGNNCLNDTNAFQLPWGAGSGAFITTGSPPVEGVDESIAGYLGMSGAGTSQATTLWIPIIVVMTFLRQQN